MTLPVITAKYQKKVLATQLKTTYTEIIQVFEHAKADYGEPQYWAESVEMGNDSVFQATIDNFLNLYFFPYINNQYVKGTAQEIGYPTFIGTLSNPGKNVKPDSSQYIKLKNGPVIRFTMNNDGTNFSDFLMYVDVNGFKKPNIRGKDVFLIEFVFSTGKVKLYGQGASRASLLDNCGKSEYGDQLCGALIEYDGWEFKDDYPW